MNLQAIANPHLIYPGQVLYLEKSGGFARLRTARHGGTPTVELSPQVRSESLSDQALPTLQMHIIEAFLSEPLVVDNDTLANAPRIIAAMMTACCAHPVTVPMCAHPLRHRCCARPTHRGTTACSARPWHCTTPSPAKCWATKPNTWAKRRWSAAKRR